MEIYEKRTKEYDYLVKTVCDWCSKDVEDPQSYETNDFDFDYSVGDCYPGDCYGNRYTFDLCFSCREKLMELLRSSGIKVRKESY